MPIQPEVVRREVVVSNRWVTLTRKDVSFAEAHCDDYYALDLPDYVAIVAVMPCGRIPLVRQYRPAVESFTLELPAGTLEPGESPEQCCARELLEEVGLRVRGMRLTGSYWPDTGRLSNQQHIFWVETEERAEGSPEPELEVVYVTPAELSDLVRKGEFRHLLHVSALYLTEVLPA